MSDYITEAFKEFNLLEDEDNRAEEFPINSAGLDDAVSFIDMAAPDEDDVPLDITDLEAEAKEDLKQSYAGKIILNCDVCHSNIFADRDNVTVDEEGKANVGEECPYCLSVDGYEIVGEVKPYEDEVEEEPDNDEDDVEIDEPEIEGDDVNEAYDKTGTDKLHGSEKLSGTKALNGRKNLLGTDKLSGHKTNASLHEAMHNTPKSYNKDDAFKAYTDNVKFAVSSDKDGEICKVNTKKEAEEHVRSFKKEDKKKGRSDINYTIKELNEDFYSTNDIKGFESIIPHSMRYKQCDVLPDGSLYWVTQESYSEDDLEKFKQAMRDYDFSKAYIATRNNSSYDMQTDLDNGVLEEIDLTSEMNEDLQTANIETDTDSIQVINNTDGSTSIDVTPTTSDTDVLDQDEVVAPLDDETQQEIADNSTSDEGEPDEVDVPVDDFDEDSFDNLGESYLKKCYENVNSYKTTSVGTNDSQLIIEGLITFDSGKQKKTNFVFNAAGTNKDANKLKFEGYNSQISKGKKAFKLNCSLNESKIISESLNYNYKTKNELNESVKVYGTVNRALTEAKKR